MPRPAGGYLTKAGEKVPGTNDITGRYQNSEGLYRWFYNNGKNGLPFRPEAAINIGSAVHKMAELDLIGATDREIETTLHGYLSAPNHLEMANNAFRAFRAWREENRVRVLGQETSIVSERYQYGGTPDLIAIINNTIGILDFKTSSKGEIYDNMKIALSAHANLWNEANPKMTIDTYHLIVLPKDGGGFKHHAFDTLEREWKMFLLQRELYEMEKAKPAKAAKSKPVEKPAKLRIRVKAQSKPMPTMTEMLLAFEDVPKVARVPVQQNIDFRWSRPAQ